MLDGRVLGASQVEYKPFGKPPLKREVPQQPYFSCIPALWFYHGKIRQRPPGSSAARFPASNLESKNKGVETGIFLGNSDQLIWSSGSTSLARPRLDSRQEVHCANTEREQAYWDKWDKAVLRRIIQQQGKITEASKKLEMKKLYQVLIIPQLHRPNSALGPSYADQHLGEHFP